MVVTMERMIWILWDILAALVVVWCVYRCAKRGFLRTLVTVLCYAVSAVLASVVSPMLAEKLYSGTVSRVLHGAVYERVEEALQQGGDASGSLITVLPEWLQAAAGDYLPAAQAQMPTTLDDSTRQTIADLVDSAVGEPVTWLLSALIFLLLFVLLAVVIRLIGRLFTGVNKLPVIGPVNMALGGVLGVAMAAIVLLLLALLLNLLILFTGDNLWWMNNRVLDQTYVLRVFQQLLPSQ